MRSGTIGSRGMPPAAVTAGVLAAEPVASAMGATGRTPLVGLEAGMASAVPAVSTPAVTGSASTAAREAECLTKEATACTAMGRAGRHLLLMRAAFEVMPRIAGGRPGRPPSRGCY
jgi:hypothetical protein